MKGLRLPITNMLKLTGQKGEDTLQSNTDNK